MLYSTRLSCVIAGTEDIANRRISLKTGVMVRYRSTTPASTTSDMVGSDSDNELMEKLHALHTDEFTYLYKDFDRFRTLWDKSWSKRTLIMTQEYVKFIVETWVKCMWSILFHPFSEFLPPYAREPLNLSNFQRSPTDSRPSCCRLAPVSS